MRLTTRFWITKSDTHSDVQMRIKIYQALNDEKAEVKKSKPGRKKSLEEMLANPDLLRKYVSQLDFDKIDFKNELLKNEKVINLINNYDNNQ
jgi:hypothetical protein